jgi:hypothetical protein
LPIEKCFRIEALSCGFRERSHFSTSPFYVLLSSRGLLAVTAMNKRKAAGDAAGGDEPKAKRAKTSGKPASAKGGKGAARDKDSDVVMHVGSGAGSKKGAGAGGAGKAKPKTSTKGSSAKPAKAAKASDASSAAPSKAAPVTTIADVAQLEKLIHESKQNANKIVSLIATAEV